MSALLPIADMCGAPADVCFVTDIPVMAKIPKFLA
jgi:hypothetical protein